MKLFLISLCLLGSHLVCGQKFVDLANISWRTSPANGINGSTEKRNFNLYTVNVKMPVVLNDRNLLLFGLEYQHTTITSASVFYTDYGFGSSMLQFAWEHKWSDKSKLLMMAIPRLNTDYNQVDFGHFQLGGLVLGTTKKSDAFEWKYGVYYNGELFGPMIVPMFGFNWEINSKWKFNALIPLNLEVSYAHSAKLNAGFKFEGFNSSYRYQLIPGVAFTNRYIDRADNNVWLFSEYHLGKNFWFQVRAGYSVLRKYRFFDLDDKMTLKLGPVNIGDKRNYSSPATVPVMFKNGVSLEARVIYRLPI